MFLAMSGHYNQALKVEDITPRAEGSNGGFTATAVTRAERIF